MTMELITSEVLKLNRLQRLEIIRQAIESLAWEEQVGNAIQDEPGLTQAQAQEIDQRMKLFEAGEMKTIPAERVTAIWQSRV